MSNSQTGAERMPHGLFFLVIRGPPSSPLFPYTTLFRSGMPTRPAGWSSPPGKGRSATRSEEHTSELQSRENLVCRLLLEKKNLIALASAPYLSINYV